MHACSGNLCTKFHTCTFIKNWEKLGDLPTGFSSFLVNLSLLASVILHMICYRAFSLWFGFINTYSIFGSTHFYRIREEGCSGRPPPPPPVHLRTDDVTWTYYTSFQRESSGDSDLIWFFQKYFDFATLWAIFAKWLPQWLQNWCPKKNFENMNILYIAANILRSIFSWAW